ncbi:MAG: preprotein translocase subunit SecG [Lawsonibacter sp.]|nr:preprotein translocase subunit SecG [Lawsonibacter sp.]
MVMTIGKILICLVSVLIVIMIMLQKPKENAGAGSVFGGGETYLNTSRNQTKEAKLDRITKIASIVFAVISFALVVVQKFVG